MRLPTVLIYCRMRCQQIKHKIYFKKYILSPLGHYIIFYQYSILSLTVIWKQILNVQTYDDNQLVFTVYSTVDCLDGHHNWLKNKSLKGVVFTLLEPMCKSH